MATTLFTQNIIACIWDFDKTLIPEYMQSPLFRRYGIDEATFWAETNALVGHYQKRGYHLAPEISYLNHLLTYVLAGPLSGLSNQTLRACGKDIAFYPGLPSFFDLAKTFVAERPEYQKHEISLEHYIVSTGIAEMVRGSAIAPHVDGIWACEFIENPLQPGFLRQNELSIEAAAGIAQIGMPCVVKPIMSSSGKGQSLLRSEADVGPAWQYAQEGGRAGAGRVIVEGFVDFDYEITLLTVRHAGGTSVCEPIGLLQMDGDYRESWQPQAMSEMALAEAKDIAEAVTGALGGMGLFGVELFVKGDLVWFSEVSPRPHDTGLVTIASQELSEFALHARAILGLPIPVIRQYGPSASAVILVEGESERVVFGNLEGALREPDTHLRLFGKPAVSGRRRMGVVACRAESIEAAREKARRGAGAVTVEL
jgi:hypothetical protein